MTEAFGVRLKWLAFGFLRDSVPPLTCLKNLKKYHVTLQLKEGAAIGDCNCATVKLVHMGRRPNNPLWRCPRLCQNLIETIAKFYKI